MPQWQWNSQRALDDFDRLVSSRGIGAAFQPIVEISTGEVAGYEALARVPGPGMFAEVQSLFEEGYRRGAVGELDWACRAAVFRDVLDKQVPPELPIFVNVEPAALGAPCPADIVGLFADATSRCRFVVEVTERSLVDDPAELLAAVERTRHASMGVALDDVGAQPASLALMPLIAPDVIKLDISLIQGGVGPEVARTVNSVLLEAERTGAVIIAEGVETERHRDAARAMGATYGQGWLFGAPGPLRNSFEVPRNLLSPFSAPAEVAETPFAELSRHREPIRSTRNLLAATSEHLELQVALSHTKAVLLSSFQTVERFGPAIRRRYERLARNTVLTAVMGSAMPPEPGAGIRGVPLGDADPLRRQWTVVVVGSEVSAALVAQQADGTTAREDEFDVIVTHDRDLVLAAARSLCQRLPPTAKPAGGFDL